LATRPLKFGCGGAKPKRYTRRGSRIERRSALAGTSRWPGTVLLIRPRRSRNLQPVARSAPSWATCDSARGGQRANGC
jgi:hypothetical protein